jgi:hypothetical protein
MKSTLLKLTVLSFTAAFLIGCASTQPMAQQNTTAAENTQKGPLNKGNGLTSYMH